MEVAFTLLFDVLVIMFFIVVPGWCIWQALKWPKRQHERRGFEVISITGETPVLLNRKEDDHG